MFIRTVIANVADAFTRLMGIAQQIVAIDAGRDWALAPIIPPTVINRQKHLFAGVAHRPDGKCARDLITMQIRNYSVGAYVWEERKGGGHVE